MLSSLKPVQSFQNICMMKTDSIPKVTFKFWMCTNAWRKKTTLKNVIPLLLSIIFFYFETPWRGRSKLATWAQSAGQEKERFMPLSFHCTHCASQVMMRCGHKSEFLVCYYFLLLFSIQYCTAYQLLWLVWLIPEPNLIWKKFVCLEFVNNCSFANVCQG